MGDAPPAPSASSADLADLINLELLPRWAREPASVPREAGEGPEEPPRREERRGRGPRPPRREGFGGGRREERRGPPRGDRRERPGRGGFGRGGPGRFPPREAVPARPPPGVDLAILPEPRAVEAVAAQVKASGRAYPLFALGRMFVARPERYRVRFRATGKEGGPAGFLQCSACGSVSRAAGDLARHALERHLADHYREEKTAEEPPKGNFAAVARCSLNGALLGPTNHHSFQAALLKLHRSRFPSMSLERFKASIVLERDPAVVEQWRQQASSRIAFVPLQGESPKPIATEAELERDFRERLLPGCSRQGKEFVVDGSVARDCADPVLRSAVRAMVAEEALFPRRLIGILADALGKAGLSIFRGPRGMLFVATARPTPFTAEPSHVAPEVWAILEHVREHPRRSRKDLARALCPAAAAPPAPAAEGAPAPSPDPRLVAFLGHLDWLVRQGHLVEYFNGELERVAAKPAGEHPARPPSPSQKPRRKRRGPAAKAPPKKPEPPAPAAEAAPVPETPSPAEPGPAPAEVPPSGTPPSPTA